VAQVLAAVRTHGQLSLARRAGQDGRMSHARFDRLIRAEGNDLTTAILRALPFVERTCNVGRLGADLWFWGDAVRTRWCFDFFGGEVPAQTGESA
jgi:CRISPR system Cascade subunit CasB